MKNIEDLFKTVRGFMGSRVILTGVNLNLFNHLEKPISAVRLAGRLSTDRRATEILLDALTGLGVIKKKGDLYSNTRLSSRFLVEGKPEYQGFIIKHYEKLWKGWSDLNEILKTGKPSNSERDHEAFIKGMHNLASPKADLIIDLIKIKGGERVLDLGGGPGTYSLSFAKRGCMVILFDMPETIEIAREYVKHNKNIILKEGNFLSDPIGKNYDLVFASNIIHIFGIKENKKLLRKISKAIKPGGRVVIHDFYLKKDRATPPSGSLFSVNMLVNTPSGRAYSLNEIKEMLRDGGFAKVTTKVFDTSVLVTARR